MKKFLAILGVAMVGLALAAPVSPAAAGPSPKVSERVKISSDCTVTVNASWGGLPVPAGELTVGVWGDSGLSTQEIVRVPITTVRGKMTLTFTGATQATDDLIIVEASVSGVESPVRVTKAAACIGWTFAGVQ